MKNETVLMIATLGAVIASSSAIVSYLKVEEIYDHIQSEELVVTHSVSNNSNSNSKVSLINKYDSIVTSSRVFSGPTQYPPSHFAAYGIVAFKERSSSQDRERHMMFCRAYMSTIPHSYELFEIPIAAQMVTVWPIERDELASSLNRKKRDIEEICNSAVENYGLIISLNAIKDAENTTLDLSGKGPYLFAWSPASEKGKKNVVVLAGDLSDVSTYEEAKYVFSSWRDDIEETPNLWVHGFDRESARVKIRRWFDSTGQKIFGIFEVK